MQNVAILGASDNPERYAYKAFHMLKEYGHKPFPVHPTLTTLEGTPVVAHLRDLKTPIDTLTMYVGPKISSGLTSEILALRPRRVIFNPGSENPELQKVLAATGIAVEEACTLVLLRTHQFES